MSPVGAPGSSEPSRFCWIVWATPSSTTGLVGLREILEFRFLLATEASEYDKES